MIVHARLVCSDGDCAAAFEAYGHLPEIDALACECGCALQVLSWPHPAPRGPATVAVLPLGG